MKMMGCRKELFSPRTTSLLVFHVQNALGQEVCSRFCKYLKLR